jgi:bifunctional isochorismate lyase/aryl carrier protein
MRKEQYYTLDTIKKISQEMLSSVEQLRRRHTNIIFQPGKAALLVLDLQEYFLSENSHAFVPNALAIIPEISKLIAAFKVAKRPIIATKHINTKEDAGMMSKWWRDLIRPKTAYSQLINNLHANTCIQIEKTQYDAFLHTTLEDTLHQQSVEQVVITGVMTHLCCETTARSAFMRGFEVFFAVDGTATYNEELHRASLLTLSHGFAMPALIEELLQTIEKNEA